MLELQANTAVTLKIGPFLDETNGKDAETGLTITQAEVRLSKNGGDIAQKNEATSCTHDELGVYGCPIDATDTNTEGRLQLWVHESGALPVFHEFMVLSQAAYASKYTAKDTGYMDINIKAVSDDTGAADNLESILDGNGITNDVDLTARSLTITNDAGVGVTVTGTTNGLAAIGTAGNGISSSSTGGNGAGVAATGNGTGTGLVCTGGATGSGIGAVGGATSGAGIKAQAQNNNDAGMELVKHGSGKDIDADETDNILADTGELQTDWTNGGRLDLILDAILNDTDLIDDGTSGLAKIAADVAAILVDTGTAGVVLGADAITAAKIADDAFSAEHFATGCITSDAVASTALNNIVMIDLAAGAPSATASIVTAINYLYENWRNLVKTTTSEITLYKDDAETKLCEADISDNGTTFSKGEYRTPN